MKNKTTVLAQEEKVAIDCAVRHIMIRKSEEC